MKKNNPIINIPFISKNEMIEVDRLMVEKYKISLVQMMENAGRNLAKFSSAYYFNGNPSNKKIIVLAGSGANGGGGLVCARHLHNRGADVKIILSKAANQFKGVPKLQLNILKKMNAEIIEYDNFKRNINADLIIESLVGYSLNGSPKGNTKKLIEFANNNKAKILSLDVPAGIDLTEKKAFEPTIKADSVLTLALPKKGMEKGKLKKYINNLYLADISIPNSLYELLPLKITNIFSENEIVKIY